MDTLEDKARILLEAAEQAGWSDAPSIVQRVKGLQRGIPAEDELSVILHWLGRCKLVHKLDQTQYPATSRAQWRVPDLLAFFDYGGHTVPVLIEVKRTKRDKLKWKRQYLESLQSYSEAVGIPLLIAWKFASLWCLFEPCHFRLAHTNLHARFLDVMPHTLMSVLAGDFSFALHPGVAWHLHWRKLKNTGPQGWHLQVERSYVTNVAGNEVQSAPGILPLLACFPNYSEHRHTRTHIHQTFTVPSGGAAEFAHRCLSQLVAVFGGRDRPKSWRAYLQGTRLPTLAENFHDTVHNLGSGFVHHLFRVRPVATPAFLPRSG
ncbi:MAG: hypothetical protein QOK37_1553 [Thermoanaerobaculia bacterium]|jgi:Holliday junction resolvase|nr:hypothetical protein [Thermoanaerobaculia bacterium]